MKGSSLFSDMFFIFVIIAISLVFTAFLWAVTVVYTVAGPNTRYVTLNLVDYPIQNNGALLSFMECTHDGIPMKELIIQSALQQETTIDYNDIEDIDVKQASEALLSQMFIGKQYKMIIKNPEIILAESEYLPLNLNKISFYINLPDKRAKLELYVGE